MIIINDTYELDFEIKNPIPVTKTNQDVKELGKRKGDFSNTITLPNNSTVRHALGFNHDPAASEFSAHTETITCRYVENGATLMDGLIKLVEASDTEIKCLIIGKQLDWKVQIADKECSELSVGTFELDITNVENTWTPGSDVVFPIIDWGYFSLLNPSVNAAADDPGYQRKLFLHDLYPAFNIGYLVRLAFNSIGFTVTVPAILDENYIFSTSRLVQAATSNYFNYKNASLISFTFAANTIIFDTAITANTDYNTTTGKYTFPENMTMRFRTMLNLTQASTHAVSKTYNVSIQHFPPNGDILAQGQITIPPFTSTGSIVVESNFQQFNTGDTVWVFITQSLSGSITPYVIDGGSTFSNELFSGNIDNETIDLSYFMPDWTQLEFIQHIKSVFNLYFNTVDRDVSIYTRDQYLSPTIIDLTDKVDRLKESYIEFFEYAKFVDFKYSQDTNDKKAPDTFANETFNTGVVVNSTKETMTTGFAATIMDYASHIGVSKKIPKIYSEDLGDRLPFRNLNIVPRILNYSENHTGQSVYVENSYFSEIPAFKFYNEIIDEGKSLLFNNNAGNGLRQRYYSEDLAIREDGRIFHCWVNYNEIQIANIDMRNIFRVDNTLFELKEIKQFQPGRSTEFELLPLKKKKVLPIQTMGGLAPAPKFSNNTNNGIVKRLFKYVAENIFTQTITSGEIDPTFSLLRIDTSVGDLSKDLPIAPEGKVFEIEKSAAANVATLNAQSGFTINGASSYDVTGTQNLRIKLVGNNWIVISDSNKARDLVENTYTGNPIFIPESDDISYINRSSSGVVVLPDAPTVGKLRYVVNTGTFKVSLIPANFPGGTINTDTGIIIEVEESATLKHIGSNNWRLL